MAKGANMNKNSLPFLTGETATIAIDIMAANIISIYDGLIFLAFDLKFLI